MGKHLKLKTINKTAPGLFLCMLQLNTFDLYLQTLQIFDPSCVPSDIHRPLMKQKPSYNKNIVWFYKWISKLHKYKHFRSKKTVTLRANLISPDTFTVSWQVESRIYMKWKGLNAFPSLLTEILYPDTKDVVVDLFLQSLGKGHITSEIELCWAPTLTVSRKIWFPW